MNFRSNEALKKIVEARLGHLIEDDQSAARDAIHVAIVPLIAGTRLGIGAKFKLKFGTTDVALPADYDEANAIGIVDPFLSGYEVEEGQRFYGVLFPGTVTGMRHHWEHPAFIEKKVEVNEHELWLRNFCDEWNFDYDQLIAAGVGSIDPDWRYATARGIDLHNRDELGEDYELFWFHLEKLTGQQFDKDHRDGMGWSCTC